MDNLKIIEKYYDEEFDLDAYFLKDKYYDIPLPNMITTQQLSNLVGEELSTPLELYNLIKNRL